MKLLRSVVPVLLLPADGVAQIAGFTSPRGLSSIEGDTWREYVLTHASSRFQQIDDTVRGTPGVLRGVALRRDGMHPTITTAGSRTIRATVLMGHFGDASGTPPVSGRFDLNYRGVPTTVIPNATYSVPNLNSLPGSAPDAFRVYIPFNFPFAFDGASALVLEARVANVSLLGRVPIDADIPADIVATGNPGPGPGCDIADGLGGRREMTATSSISSGGQSRGLRWDFSSYGPPGSFMGLLVGSGIPGGNPLPGPPCAPVYSTGDLFLLTLPNASGTGTTGLSVPLPHNPTFPGNFVYLQTFGIDAAQPMSLALSRGVKQGFPTDPRLVAAQHLYASNVGATSGALTPNGGLVMQFYR